MTTIAESKYLLPTMVTRPWAVTAHKHPQFAKGLAMAEDICAKMKKMGFPLFICHYWHTDTYPDFVLSTADHIVLFRVRFTGNEYWMESPFYAVKERGDHNTIRSSNPRYILNALNRFSEAVIKYATEAQSARDGLVHMVKSAHKKCFRETTFKSFAVRDTLLAKLLDIASNKPDRAPLTAEEEQLMIAHKSTVADNFAARQRNKQRMDDMFSCPKWVLRKSDITGLTTVSAWRISDGGANIECIVPPMLWENINHFREFNPDTAQDLEVSLNMAKTNIMSRNQDMSTKTMWGELGVIPAIVGNNAEMNDSFSNLELGVFTYYPYDAQKTARGVVHVVDKSEV